jgi:isochorismate synthase
MTVAGGAWVASRATGLTATAVDHDPIDPIALFGTACAAGLDASLWSDQGTGRTLVGIDVAVRLALDGPERFVRLAEAWRGLTADMAVTGPAAASPLAGPMLLGGAAFRDHPSTDARWEGFGSLAFDLPRLIVAMEDGLTVVTRIEGGAPGVPPVGLLEQFVDGIRRVPSPATASSVTGLHPDRAAWSGSVARITGAVGRGRLDKVVLARRVDLRAERAIDTSDVVRRMVASVRADPSPGARLPSTVFAIARGGRAFLGSTPERLASVRGRSFRTMALAGTTPRGLDASDDASMGAALLASEKDREEHAVVAAMLRETLDPLVIELGLPRTPRIVRGAQVQHLLSDASGTLRPGVGLLEVVQRLHPTPAVAGWPTEAALELLDEESDLDRGWYAGPVGWLDRAGDGDVSVAIRSALVHGCDASLYAGCGIVADSEPDREWDESSLKLRVMGDALGWDGT